MSNNSPVVALILGILIVYALRTGKLATFVGALRKSIG